MKFFRVIVNIIAVLLMLTVNRVFSQPFPNSSFETGTNTGCTCPTGYTCANDAGRVVTGFHPVYLPGNQGCVTGPTNYALSLGAHTGTAAVYFYAGADRVTTPVVSLTAGTKICLCTWYAGPQGSGASGQNTANCYFRFGANGIGVSPSTFVPVNTGWTQYCYLYTVPSNNNYSFNILSGGAAQYAIWFDDFEVTVCTALPVELISFNASRSDDEVRLQWLTASETNCEYFTLQKSSDGSDFTDVTHIKALGSNNQPGQYSFTDTDPYTGLLYYRLQMTDLDGGVTYSQIIYVEYEMNLDIRLYPNPGNGSFILELNDDVNNALLHVYSLTGQLVYTFSLEQGVNHVALQGVAAGMYQYVITAGSERLLQGMVGIE